MNPRHIIAALALSAAAAGALAPVAGATSGEVPKLELDGAYAYVNTLPSKQKMLQVVFRTTHAVERRGDGSIQAGVSIDGVSHSIGAAKRGTSCYTGASEIKGGSIATNVGNTIIRKGAKLGRTFTIVVSDRHGQSVTKTVKLRAERPGDDRGKPLGC